MSPRAACRLETLGFREVYDYFPGKVDWLARGLPSEGEDVSKGRVGQVVRGDVVTCRLSDRAREVGELISASPYGFALVTSDGGVVLGRLRRSAIGADGERSAAELLEPGPSTVRPHAPLGALVERLRKRDLRTAVVTSPDGKLIGVLRRDEAEARLR
jgi:CBS domain-containing protein